MTDSTLLLCAVRGRDLGSSSLLHTIGTQYLLNETNETVGDGPGHGPPEGDSGKLTNDLMGNWPRSR